MQPTAGPAAVARQAATLPRHHAEKARQGVSTNGILPHTLCYLASSALHAMHLSTVRLTQKSVPQQHVTLSMAAAAERPHKRAQEYKLCCL